MKENQEEKPSKGEIMKPKKPRNLDYKKIKKQGKYERKPRKKAKSNSRTKSRRK